MNLPSLSDYNAAVQTPGTCFLDQELQACTVETTPLGLPRPRSGGFAITYHLSNHRDWAVRCFYKSVPDLEARYRHITAYLHQCRSPRFVHFEYQPNGILVYGRRYPIVKMEWVKGETLGSFVAQHYRDGAAIKRLREDFVDLVLHLERLRIAHGDLQHGNIVVDTSGQQLRLRLIDYDGMYVPGMERHFQTSSEVGHPHYQHPARTNDHFGPYLDRFSAAIIYLSLILLERDPTLFDRYHTGENLLFTSADYANPSASPLVQEFRQRYQGKQIWQGFELLLALPPDQLPRFEDFYHARLPQHAPPPTPSVPVPAPPVPRVRSPYPVLPAENAAGLLRREGEVVEVIGQVVGYRRGATRFGSPYVFLNFGDWRQGAFYVALWEEVLTEFERRGLKPEALRGQWVSVTGLITSYQHKTATSKSPQIQLERVHNLRLLSEEEARQYLAAARLNGASGRNRDRIEQHRGQHQQTTLTQPSPGQRSSPTPSPGQTSPGRGRRHSQQSSGSPSPQRNKPSNRDRLRQHGHKRPSHPRSTARSGTPTGPAQPTTSPARDSGVGELVGGALFLFFLLWLVAQCAGG